MFCQNCGNRVDENAYVCVNCGVFIRNRSNSKVVKEKKVNKRIGVIATIFGIFSLMLSMMLYFYDISSVGMYTEIYERILYTLNYSLFAILFTSVALVFSLIDKRKKTVNVGLMLSLISFFFIITEFIVVIIY